MEYLDLVSLKSIRSGSVAAGYNERMCYVNGIRWDELFHWSNQSFKAMGNMASDACGWCTELHVNLYTVNHKKRDILFFTITLANLNRFL